MDKSISYISDMLNVDFEDLFRMIGNVSQEFLWFKDKQSRFVYSNHAHNKGLGIDSPEELIGKSDFDFYPKAFAQQTYDDEQNLMDTGKAQIGKEEYLKLPNGRAQWIQSSKYVLYDRNNQIIGVWGIGSNITKRKEIELKLEDTNRRLEDALALSKEMTEAAKRASMSKGQFLANMSHEIRTPMNAIIGLSELMYKTDLDEKQLDYIKKITSSAKALLSIINSILDFSKIEAGKMELEAVPFNLDDVLNSLSSMLTLKAEQKNVEFIFDISINVPQNLIGDPVRLTQVLVNLVNNALKFTERGVITLKMLAEKHDEEHTKLFVAVTDTGIGMKKSQIDRLFQPFTQADASMTRQYGGTGLGLAISKEIVELMGGEIKVKSAYGKGSCFSFEIILPFDQKKNKRRICPSTLKDMQVMVVDDNAEARRIEARMLESFGFHVFTAASAQEAVELIGRAECSPKLILMDYLMPDMDGIEATREIRRRCRDGQVPEIMMVSAFNKDNTKKAAKKAGVNRFMDKPINPSLLFNEILYMFNEERIVCDQDEQESRAAGNLDAIRGARILLVEDNIINQQVAKELLVSEGFEVQIAENGRQALDVLNRAESGAFDCVLMDIQMPVMDGREASRLLRATDCPNRDIPIIAMTAHALEDEKEKNMLSGMNGQVNKPFETEELYQTLLRFIKPKERAVKAPDKKNKDRKQTAADICIDGIDTDAGLSRTVGNIKLYHELLWRFYSSYSDIMVLLDKNEADGKTEENEVIMHTLKAAGGNLGAERLYDAAAAMERMYKAGKSIRETKADFEDELTYVLHHIHTYLSGLPDKKSKSEAHCLTNHVLAEMARKLKAQLNEYNVQATETAEALAEGLDESMASDFKKIAALTSDLVYAEALDALNAFMKKYKIARGGSIHDGQ